MITIMINNDNKNVIVYTDDVEFKTHNKQKAHKAKKEEKLVFNNNR